MELAPWMGGVYERLVGTVKGALKKSIGKICLTQKKLETFLTEAEEAEAEAVINSCPLVYVGGFHSPQPTFLILMPSLGFQ